MSYLEGVISLARTLEITPGEAAALLEDRAQYRLAVEQRNAELKRQGRDAESVTARAIEETRARVTAAAREETRARLAGDPRACLAYMNSRRR